MKKINKILFFAIISMFLFVCNVKAEDVSITCPKTATVGEPFSCNITTNQSIVISSDLRIYEGSAEMNKSGTIKFKATKAQDYDITLAYEDVEGILKYKTATVSVKNATTTTTTTTTTKSKSDNNYLSSITVDGEEVENFNKITSKYFVEVENDVTKIDLDAEAEDDTATVEIDGPKSLEVGDNEFTISVTSESDSTKIYKVIITRKEEEESSNNDIKNIKVKGYHLNFDKSSKTFYLTIDKEDTELDITVDLKDDTASYEIEGNENLEDGSVIKIIVEAEDGTKDTYRIIIQKKDTNYVPLIISLIIIFIIIGIVTFVIIKKKNKKENSNNTPKNKKQVKEDKKNIEDEKTIEMPTITEDNKIEELNDNENNEEDFEDDIIHIDNDEDEKTRMLSYAEKEELEKTKLLSDDEINNKIDEELEKTLLFNYENEDYDDE